MQFIELKDARIYPAQNGVAKEIGDIVLNENEIRGFERVKMDEMYTMLSLRNGNILVTATPYAEIKSKLIGEEKIK